MVFCVFSVLRYFLLYYFLDIFVFDVNVLFLKENERINGLGVV